MERAKEPPMAYHFVNDTTVNLFHVVTVDGIDDMQTVRLTITGTLSFAIVLVLFLVKMKKAITDL